MQFKITVLLALATAAFAVPAPAVTVRAVSTIVPTPAAATKTLSSVVSCLYSTFNPVLPTPVPFTNATCKLSKALTPGQPLICTFPTADKLGDIIGPNLRTLIGDKAVGDIDVAAEDLCVSARTNKKDGNGLCNEALQAVYDIAVHQQGGQAAADKYRCLLNLLCIAPANKANNAPCQYLTAGVDCVANRIIQDKPFECSPSPAPGR